MNLYKIYGMDQDGKVHERHIVAHDHEAACRAWREFGPKEGVVPTNPINPQLQPVAITETQEIGKSLIIFTDPGKCNVPINRPVTMSAADDPSNFDLSPGVSPVGDDQDLRSPISISVPKVPSNFKIPEYGVDPAGGHRLMKPVEDPSVEIGLDASGNPVYIPRENK